MVPYMQLPAVGSQAHLAGASGRVENTWATHVQGRSPVTG